jgi:hypothetical protein
MLLPIRGFLFDREYIMNLFITSGRNVPVAASYDALLSASIGENRLSDSVDQRPSCAHNGPLASQL